MGYILWSLELRFLILRNTLWKDPITIIKTLSVTAVVIAAQLVLINVFYRYIFRSIMVADEMVKVVLMVVFFLVLSWIYLISFMQSMNTYFKNFHGSPDMNYLLSIPIPLNYVFLIKFIGHILTSAKSMLFLFFPFLAAVGWWVNAPITYYVIIIPLYIIATIIPCVIGVLFAMVGHRFISAKLFSKLTSILVFATNIAFAILIARADLSAPYISRIIDFLSRPWISDVVPATASLKLFYSSILGESVRYTTPLFLIISSILAITVAFKVAEKLFFEGWTKNQSIDSKIPGKKITADNNTYSSQSEAYNWIKTEWVMAARNTEMLMGAVSFLLVYCLTSFVFAYRGFFANEPLLGVALLITISSVLNIMAVSILFLPAAIAKDSSIWKQRFWLLKILPLKESKVFDIQCLMLFIPGFIISLVGLLAYSTSIGLSFSYVLLSSVCLFFILYGSSALYASVELLSLSDFFEKNSFAGSLITFVAPVIYGVFCAGSITLYLGKNYVAEVMILSRITPLLSFPIVTMLSVLTLVAAYWLSRVIFVRTWKHLQF